MLERSSSPGIRKLESSIDDNSQLGGNVTAIDIPTPDPRTFDDDSRPFAEAVSSHYAIKKMIGRGGMGVVYLARDRRLDRLVAIKTLPPHLAGDPSLRERFLRETRAAGAMSHPNIVPVHGADEIDGHVFFVMGFVDGESLATHVGARGTIDAATVRGWLRDVAQALSHAHRRGLVHRDIKAENILIERSTGRALVTDFGIARLAEAGPLTATGQLLGTVYYVSPEQVEGGVVDSRSDLYSLGVVGFLALTGRFPFEGDLASAVLVAHVTRPAPPVRSLSSNVPESLAKVIDRCLVKNPAERFASAEDLLAALDHELDDDRRSSDRARLISDTEARGVWKRAADLQSVTGFRTRPESIVRTRSTGFSIGDVRSAASEAGIDEKYVERALAERGLVGEQRVAVRSLPRSATRRSLWAGVPLDIVVDTEADAPTDSRQFDTLVNTLRESTTTLGDTTLKKSNELTWTGGWFGHRLEANVASSDGRTQIRLTQSVRRAALATLAASLATGAGAGIAVGAALDLLMTLPAPVWSVQLDRGDIGTIAAVSGVAIAIVCFRAGRSLIKRMREYNAARLRTLGHLLAARAGDGEE
jgi:serine/threonine protein kinase